MKDRLIEILLGKGLLNDSLLASLNVYMNRWRASSYTALLETRMICESTLADCVAELLKIERVFSLDSSDFLDDATSMLTFRQSHTWLACPLGTDSDGFFDIVMADPTNIEICKSLEKVVNEPVKYLVGEKKVVRLAINLVFPVELQMPHLLNLAI